MSTDDRWHWLRAALAERQRENGLRRLHDTVLLADGRAEREGRLLLNLASNDYLGFAAESKLEAETDHLTWGAGASRLVTGSQPLMSEFERAFAAFKEKEAVLLFNSGYSTNIGVLAALVGRDAVVFSDRLNHASIIDGILLSRANLIRYRHRDLNDLEHLLKQSSPRKRRWIVTDALFSMDGTIAPLSDLVTLKQRYGAYLYVDEAHSGGVFGAAGQGLVHQLKLTEHVDVLMGTFSKAYGVFGGYVACDAVVRDYLINHARSLIYTTAMPPVVVAKVRNQWLRACAESWRREQVLDLAGRFRAGLLAMGLDAGQSESQIVPLLLEQNERAVAWEKELLARGVLAAAIRPPTVPDGTARIRFSWTAAHRSDDVEYVLAQLRSLQMAECTGDING